MQLRFDPDHRHPLHKLVSGDRTMIRDKTDPSQSNWQGAISTHCIPKTGIYRYWCHVKHNVWMPANYEQWIGVGVANRANWNSLSTGWWTENDGTGLYGSGDVFSYDNELPSMEPIPSDCEVSVEVNRSNGSITFYINDENVCVGLQIHLVKLPWLLLFSLFIACFRGF